MELDCTFTKEEIMGANKTPAAPIPKDDGSDQRVPEPEELTIQQKVTVMANIFVELPREAQMKILKSMADFLREEMKIERDDNINRIIVPGDV